MTLLLLQMSYRGSYDLVFSALSLLVLCVLSFTSVKSDQDSEIDPVTEFVRTKIKQIIFRDWTKIYLIVLDCVQVPSALGKVQVSSQNDAGFTYLYAEFEASFTIPYKVRILPKIDRLRKRQSVFCSQSLLFAQSKPFLGHKASNAIQR